MDRDRLTSPFDQRKIEEVRLRGAPLALVVTQVRHPALVALLGEGGRDVAIDLARNLAGEYPVIGDVQEVEFKITKAGVDHVPGANRIWQLKTADDCWSVSFASEFLALETTSYTGRQDFRSRFDRVVRAYTALVAPPRVERTGLRYLNRISDPKLLLDLPELIISEVLGPLGTTLPEDVAVSHLITQILFQHTDLQLKVQWGRVPAGVALDAAIPAAGSQSWVLDIDSFTASNSDFQPEALLTTFERLASQARRCFRWAVTDQYLERFREPT